MRSQELCLYVEMRDGDESMIRDWETYLWLQRCRLRYSENSGNNFLYESEVRHDGLW